ncbi:MAG TPA: family 16 glycoside hydrolase, partial [Parapedobacter sp.]|nr:family 16 glycoside hydrolase [Parapedobacter sp.]
MNNSKMKQLIALAVFITSSTFLQAQVNRRGNPADTEVWEPIPAVVNPGKTNFDLPPSDAIVLFEKDNLDEWESTRDKSPAKWVVTGDYFTVNKPSGDIQTKRVFKDYQLHIEWRVPAEIE